MEPLILLLLAWATLIVERHEALFLFPGVPSKTIVQIINNVTDPPQDLTLHCKSKDDDLGEHTISVGGKYEFIFRPNVLKPVTLFFCNFRWPSDTSFHYFDIYIQKRDEDSCLDKDVTLCYWKIWKGGACKYDKDLKTYTNCYPWNPAPAIVASSVINTSFI
ncbi:S-protein homolog 5-like [Prosopis cineraria]|uniref:S-protein homolog 5-like n=1 Tax=Prosopis cineraria TaxID=364024 RepID=UPI00240F330C|nr:S-protein homolog 5-like [Prosopis cineraria]